MLLIRKIMTYIVLFVTVETGMSKTIKRDTLHILKYLVLKDTDDIATKHPHAFSLLINLTYAT